MTKDTTNLVIYEEGTPAEALEKDAKNKESFPLSAVSSFRGSRASAVKVLVSNSDALLNQPEILTTILENVLELRGKLVIEASEDFGLENGAKLKQQMKFSGFVGVHLEGKLIFAEKDQFEVGEAVKLNFGAVKPSGVKTPWTVSTNNDDEDELIDDEELLDEDDLKKPDPESLRVCGTTGKRKACKDCSCGLSEELEGEKRVKAAAAVLTESNGKSACGNCYLGDAFRCASCPYFGTPAFKPGEKIQLTEAMLQPDL